MRDRILALLAQLVAADTRNPPRAIAVTDQLFPELRTVLETAGFTVELRDLSRGSVSLHAVRGRPRLLCNVHLDTVSDGGSWKHSPHELRVEADRASGLGACDAKGGAACLVAAVQETPGDLAILFTTDEEGGDERCVREFVSRADVAGGRGGGQRGRASELYAGVIVGEPTSLRAVTAHRGMASAELRWSARAGHGSDPRALADSAVHAAVRWSARALAFAVDEEQRDVGGLSGIRLNLGMVHGGVEANVIADRCSLRFGVRSRPTEDAAGLTERLAQLDPAAAHQILFAGPSLPPPGRTTQSALTLATRFGLSAGPPVDFWSEASLFAAAGLPALVFGPGSITEAHTAGEWVALTELDGAYDRYRTIVSLTKSLDGAA